MFLKIKYLFIFILLVVVYFFGLYSSVLASWIADLTPPVCTIRWSKGSGMMASEPPINVFANASDSDRGNSYIIASSITLIVTPTPAPELVSISSTPATSVTKIYTWHPVPTEVTTYRFSLTAYDSALNRCSVINNFLVNINPPAWMKVSGDVHTNK